jgi:hypothetical protein
MSAQTTDCAPALLGNREELQRWQGKAEILGNTGIVTFHCRVSQENLCAKPFPVFQHVVSVVTRAVNLIQSKGLNLRQLQNFLSESGFQCGYLVCYSDVRWLSRSKTLKRVFSLRKEVQDFMESKESLFLSFRIHSECFTLDYLSTLLGL